MKEQIIEILNSKLFISVLMLLVGFLSSRLNIFGEKLNRKLKDIIPDKYEPMFFEVLKEFSTGLIGEIPTKKIVEKFADKIIIEAEKKFSKKTIEIGESLLKDTEEKIMSLNVKGDSTLSTNYDVSKVVHEQIIKLKENPETILTAYAEAKADKEGFKEGVLGASIVKGIYKK